MEAARKETFFSHDREFYHSLFAMMLVVAIQNLVSYSVNMADNIMLGAYSQEALSGAAVVNQVFFLVQQMAISIGDGLVVLCSQYWGQKRTEPIRRLTGLVLRVAFCAGILLIILCTLFPRQILEIFTSDEAILRQGMQYLNIIKYTFLLFLLTQVLLSALRSVETVKIAFFISCLSLVINICVNSTLIYGRFGFPEMGVRGAAVGTIISRIVELLVVLFYICRKDTKLELFRDRGCFTLRPELEGTMSTWRFRLRRQASVVNSPSPCRPPFWAT